MRIFWLFVVVLLIAAVVPFVVGRTPAGPALETTAAPPAPTPLDDPASETPSDPDVAEPAVTDPIAAVDAEPAPTPPSDAAQALADELMASAEAGRPTEAVVTDPGVAELVAVAPAPETPAPSTDTPEPEPVATKTDDDETVDAPAFEIRGEGTAEDPYQISWDLLVSASETYRPRLEMLDIPELVQTLDGAHVRISGFVAVPLVVGEVNEALVMLNQWDGCCIGVPPTPYDAVEVRLAHKIAIPRHQMIPYGTVEGLFKVDPYLVSGWLVGLYIMEDATLEMGM